ncbi:MAG TPA: radical SAM protein [Candidatus Sulfotelmatobacter sp.]|nr:radical SAM protein [Candidatus Sulfotelmatobacter sp.]
MNTETLAQFNQSRSIADKAVQSLCYAPHTNLFFSQNGDVRACCWNWKHTFGNALHDSIDEIWRGTRVQILRRALEGMDFGPGCELCDQQTANGWIARPPMRNFDQFAVPTAVPEWPQRMEFSISNSCNLECVMCSGRWSSAIRAHREKLPPHRICYSPAFIASLRKYLPHLSCAKFLGGEPFLISEYYQIWDMMIADGLKTDCHITTNGTQYNHRIEGVMNALPMSLAVSLDGATKKTVESIRINANYDDQMRILKRFREYTLARKTDLSLTFCFMRQNWFEFGDFCLFGDEMGCNVGVNTVTQPPEFAVYNLPAEELRRIFAAMEQQTIHIESHLKRNRTVWFAELDRLRRRCQQADERVAPVSPSLVVIA